MPPSPTPLPEPSTLVALFEAQAKRSAHSPAVTGSGRTLTYAELDRRANHLAARLQDAVKPGDLVGIALERTPELLVGLLGIMKAGAAYVPIDPTYPEARIRELLRPVAVKDTKRELAPSGAIQALTDALRALRAPDAPQLADKHLLTMAEAHALGWPRQVLRALKDSADPPGIRYGKRGFKFFASMLRDGKSV